MGWRFGVDTGGTFTDVCMFEEETGLIHVWKTISTPEDPSLGIVDVVQQGLCNVDAKLEEISYFGHGTTVATNALIELRGAETVLLTTAGFRDLLEIGRQKRPSLYDMMADKPPVLVPRNRRLQIVERLRADGSVELPLNQETIELAIKQIRDGPHEAIAICFLYGYLNNEHEKMIGSRIRKEFEGSFISISHEVSPEFREFERVTTTVVNSFLGPIMGHYIDRLGSRLIENGLTISPNLTQSNGGVIGFDTARKFPVKTLLSGPSTGVIAAQAIAAAAGFNDIITFDAGGTSSDVALLKDRICGRTTEAEIHGYPIKAPMLDIHTVGAGGGSIAYVDNGGLLKVGPKSAGADPGPVCYGRGGTEPTLTDANIVLQILDPVEILGGRMKVRKDLAESSINKLANQLDLSLEEAAQGIISVATANMAKALRVISVQRGYDPREYTLMAYGGAGPLHAARLARELDMSRVIVPKSPGTLCALGLLMTDLMSDFVQALNLTLDNNITEQLRSVYSSLDKQAMNWFDTEGIDVESQYLRRIVDLRYAGQNYELQVDFPLGTIDCDCIELLRERFDAVHQQRFGFAVKHEVIELINLRVVAIGQVQKAQLHHDPELVQKVPAPIGSRTVWMPEASGFASCGIYDRSELRFGQCVIGPAVIQQMDTTTFVLPEMTAKVDAHHNLILEFCE